MRQAVPRAVRRWVRPPSSAGLLWPRRSDTGHLNEDERSRLLQYERLMGTAHLVSAPIALAAALVHIDFVSRSATGGFAAVVALAVVFAAVYHLVLPRVWLSHTKVVLGLIVDSLLVTEVVMLTGYHMSLLVFLYYLIVIAGALALETPAMFGICAVICGAFAAQLPFDPLFRAAPGAHLAHVILFVASVWLVGLGSAAVAAQIHRAERRLLTSLRLQQEIAERNTQLSGDLAVQLQASRALAASLQHEREETQRLADMVIRAQEEERRRVARELHDEANQTLAALMTTIDTAEQLGADAAHAELRATLARLRRLATATLGDLQRIATELRPPALDEFGLVPALTRHVEERTTGTTLHADMAVEGRRRRLPAAVEVALYRIAQEALANVQKHGQARTVHVRLRFAPDRVRLDVSDDGAGFDTAAPRPGREGLGLPGMRERASLVGGALEVSSRPGGGTRVSAVVPLTDAADPLAAAS